MKRARQLLAMTGLSVGLVMSSPSWSQQQPSSEALSAARTMVAAQQNAGASTALVGMAEAALNSLPQAKLLQPEIKAEIAQSAARAAFAQMPIASDEVASVYASAMTVDEMRSVTAFFEGTVVRGLMEAQSKLKVEPGKPPEMTEELKAASEKMGEFFKSDAGRKLFALMRDHAPALQRAQMQWLMAVTSAVNDAVKAEMAKRGITP